MVPPLFALFTFPIAVAVFFARMTPERAIVTSIILGYLFLPHGRGLDLPMIPPINKDFVPAVAALVAMLIVLVGSQKPAPRHLTTWLPRTPLILIFLLLIPLGIVGTAMTNGDSLAYGRLFIPGLSPYDIASQLIQTAVMLLPFFLARRFLCHPDQHVSLLWLLVAAGMAYSFLSLFETRFSPQLNTKIYGYFQHDWNQHLRDGGFRPIIFLQHGLWVSIFFSTVVLAALTLARQSIVSNKRYLYLYLALWALLVLALTKSLGALVITLALAPVILFCSTRLQIKVAMVLAIIVMTYPALRGGGFVPIDKVYSIAESIDPNRALSLGARLQNEELLLEKAQQRPLFGWGSWGRNYVYDTRGYAETVTDGYWIIIISTNGWVGYIGIFGLLSSGIIGMFLASRRMDISPATAGLTVILAGNMVDLIPNATLTPLTWMIAGALLGRFELGKVPDSATQTEEPAAKRTLQYSRFGPRHGQKKPVHGLNRDYAVHTAARERPDLTLNPLPRGRRPVPRGKR